MAYRPNNVDQSGQILAQSLSKASNRLFDASAQRKKLETLLGTMNPELKPELGNFNLSELEGMVDVMAAQRVEKKLAMEQQAQDRADKSAQVQEQNIGFQQDIATQGAERADEYLGLQKNAQYLNAAAQDIERGAILAAYSGPASTEDLAASIAGGASFEQLPTTGSQPSVQRYVQAGGTDPKVLNDMADAAAGPQGGFKGDAYIAGYDDAGKAIQMVPTSAKSAIPVPGQSGVGGKAPLDPIDVRLKREKMIDDLWGGFSASNPAWSLRQYYAETRDVRGKLKKDAETNAADERKIAQIKQVRAQMEGGKPSEIEIETPQMTPEEFVQSMQTP